MINDTSKFGCAAKYGTKNISGSRWKMGPAFDRVMDKNLRRCDPLAGLPVGQRVRSRNDRRSRLTLKVGRSWCATPGRSGRWRSMPRPPRAGQLPRAADRCCASAALVYACKDTLSEAAITDIIGPRLSAALALWPKHLDRRGYFVDWWPRHRRRMLHDRGLVADPLPHGAASSGSSPWKAANRRAGPQQIAFGVLSTGRSSWAIAVTYPSGVYPSPISSAPTGFTILAGSSNQSSGWDRACSSHCRLASDDGGAVTMSALPPQNRHRQLDRHVRKVPGSEVAIHGSSLGAKAIRPAQHDFAALFRDPSQGG
jgi:hypothetical protein